MLRINGLPALAMLGALSLFATGCESTPTAEVDEPNPIITTGHGVIAAMHARYDGRWYRNLKVTQEVVRYDQDGNPQPQPTWIETIPLPGRVRSAIGAEDSGNLELYIDGAFKIVRDGEVVQEAERPHPVLHIGYDVYCQPISATTAQLEAAGFDLERWHETTWDNQLVYVVGADAGDETAKQFWVDTKELLCHRIITQTQSGKMLDIQFTKYTPFAGVWLCTELKFYLDGNLVIHEWDIGHELLDPIPAETFRIPSS